MSLSIKPTYVDVNKSISSTNSINNHPPVRSVFTTISPSLSTTLKLCAVGLLLGTQVATAFQNQQTSKMLGFPASLAGLKPTNFGFPESCFPDFSNSTLVNNIKNRKTMPMVCSDGKAKMTYAFEKSGALSSTQLIGKTFEATSHYRNGKLTKSLKKIRNVAGTEKSTQEWKQDILTFEHFVKGKLAFRQVNMFPYQVNEWYKDNELLAHTLTDVTPPQANPNNVEYDRFGRIVYRGEKNIFGERHGIGKEYDLFGRVIYDGEWSNDKRNGQGKEYLNGHRLYSGKWRDGDRYGYGTLYHSYSDRVAFQGEWRNGREWGNGKQYDHFGVLIQEGEWLDGWFQSPEKSCMLF